MNSQIRVSVIIPVYNVAKYLPECLESVLQQTLRDIEIICLNDGSKDNSLEILEAYGKKDDRIRIIDQENRGVTYTRNEGIKAASGEFIAFMDPDDYYPSAGVLSQLYDGVRAHNVLICGGSLWQFWEQKDELRKEFDYPNEKFIFTEEGFVDYRDYQFDYGFYRFIYERTFLLENSIFFPEYSRFGDPPFFLNAMIKAGRFYAVPECTYCLRIWRTKYNLTEKMVCDLIRGLTDDLVISSGEDLRELHLLTLFRFKKSWASWIREGFELRSVLMMELLAEAQKAVRQDWLPDSEPPSVYEGLFDSFGVVKEKLDRREAMLQEIRDSTAFRIGSVITLIPGKIKRKIRKTS